MYVHVYISEPYAYNGWEYSAADMEEEEEDLEADANAEEQEEEGEEVSPEFHWQVKYFQPPLLFGFTNSCYLNIL